jgi:antitoxin component YwqK of YwqJK toxin-antitoxin module
LADLNYKNGKKIEYSSYPAQDKLIKKIEFFNDVRMDSLSRYFEGKLVQTKYDFDLVGNSKSIRKYFYENDELVKVIKILIVINLIL